MNNVLIIGSFLYTARIEYENYYMTSSQKVISPGGNVNISGPVPGTFQHSKEITETPKTAMRRPQMQLPNIPAPGEMQAILTFLLQLPR